LPSLLAAFSAKRRILEKMAVQPLYAMSWVSDNNVALFTDLYELTMLQAYWREGLDTAWATFDLFIRQTPGRNYLLACGLDTVLHYLEILRFTPEALDYLGTLNRFSPDFLAYLAEFRFTGDVYAVPEGTPVFAGEPLLQIVAPIGQAQLIETFVLNQITFQTGVASKASRVVQAAQGRLLADFGARRMHGADAALKAVRAYYIAGIQATSLVLGGQLYGVPVTGTMAHSYIEAHLTEEEAFRTFAQLYPGTTLLVDTYDTLEGVRKVIALHQKYGEQFIIGAIRLDSGDLAALARQARQMLDAAGLTQVKIFASGSLDEYRIAELLAQGAPIDGFGVGTRMGTISDRPYLDSAYKLSEFQGEGRMKLSLEKANLPGRKQVFRFYNDAGEAAYDLIACSDETFADGEPLLQCVMQQGKRTEAGKQTLEAARQRAQEGLRRLPKHLLSLEEADPPYPVRISARLEALGEAVRQRILQD
jgi:nicotinate phosphoribosyltransferase